MIAAPVPLTAEHDLSSFACGEPSLDHWLRRRAMTNQISGASRTYVIAGDGGVAGYYCLSAGSVGLSAAIGRVRRNMPDPVPVMVLGRLAVAIPHQGRGLGTGLLRDAVLRTLQAGDIVGCRALLVRALHEKAAQFYENAGFQPSPVDPLVYMILLDDARKALLPVSGKQKAQK